MEGGGALRLLEQDESQLHTGFIDTGAVSLDCASVRECPAAARWSYLPQA